MEAERERERPLGKREDKQNGESSRREQGTRTNRSGTYIWRPWWNPLLCMLTGKPTGKQDFQPGKYINHCSVLQHQGAEPRTGRSSHLTPACISLRWFFSSFLAVFLFACWEKSVPYFPVSISVSSLKNPFLLFSTFLSLLCHHSGSVYNCGTIGLDSQDLSRQIFHQQTKPHCFSNQNFIVLATRTRNSTNIS